MTDDLHTPDAASLPEPEPQEPPRSATTNTRRIDLKYNPHEGIDEPYLIFPNNQQGIAAAADLSTYISRARSLDIQAAIRLTARGSVLAVFACSLAPETMLDNTPTILGMRALNLAKPSTLDIVVDSAALLERLARIEESEMVLYLPPVTVHTEWAGKAAPQQGWEKLGTIDADEFRRASREGLAAVEKALPENPQCSPPCEPASGHLPWCLSTYRSLTEPLYLQAQLSPCKSSDSFPKPSPVSSLYMPPLLVPTAGCASLPPAGMCWCVRARERSHELFCESAG